MQLVQLLKRVGRCCRQPLLGFGVVGLGRGLAHRLELVVVKRGVDGRFGFLLLHGGHAHRPTRTAGVKHPLESLGEVRRALETIKECHSDPLQRTRLDVGEDAKTELPAGVREPLVRVGRLSKVEAERDGLELVRSRASDQKMVLQAVGHDVFNVARIHRIVVQPTLLEDLQRSNDAHEVRLEVARGVDDDVHEALLRAQLHG